MRFGGTMVLAVVAGTAAGCLLWFAGDHGRAETAEVARGRVLYAEHCAGCHGANLEGQPNWHQRLPNGRLPAPPHDRTGHTWHHSDEVLFQMVRDGLASILPGYETDMPAYRGVLADDEIRAVLSFIRSTWPERERNFQAARSQRGQGRVD